MSTRWVAAVALLAFGASRAHAELCRDQDLDPCALIWSAESVLTAQERTELHSICQATQRGALEQAEAEWHALGPARQHWIARRLAGWPLGAKLLAKALPSTVWGDNSSSSQLADRARCAYDVAPRKACELRMPRYPYACPLANPEAAPRAHPSHDATSSCEMCPLAGLAAKLNSDTEACTKLGTDLEGLLQRYLDENKRGSIMPVHITDRLATERAWSVLHNEFGPRALGEGTTPAVWAEPSTSTLIVFFGGSRDDIHLVLGEPHPGFMRVKLATVTRGTGIYLALVPRHALVSVSVRRGDEHLQLSHVIADDEEVVHWLDRPTVRCVEVVAALEPASRLYIDGEQLCSEADVAAPTARVRRYRTYVPRTGLHELTVVGRPAAGGPRKVVLAQRSIDVRDLDEGRCAEVRLDLRQSETHAAVALLGVSTSQSCLAAGTDRGRLHYAVTEELRKLQRDVKDIETWTETIEGLGSLKAALQAFGGETIGADRSRLDAPKAMADGAQELFRQGFGLVLSTSLECSRNKRGAWEYALVGRMLDVEALVEATRDTVTGIDLENVVRSRIELATDRTRQRSALAKLLADLLEMPYLRFEQLPERTSFLDPFEVAVEARASGAVNDVDEPTTNESERDSALPRAVVFASRALDADAARRVCHHVDLDGALGAQDLDTLRAGPWHAIHQVDIESHGEVAHESHTTTAPAPGRQLVYAALLEQGEHSQVPIAEDFACIELIERKPALWLDLGLIADAIGRRGLRGAPSGPLLMLSAGPADSAFEAKFGYLQANRELAAPLSWDELSQPLPYDEQGRLQVDIQSTHILLGGAWRVLESFEDDRLCTVIGGFMCWPGLRRLGFVARVGGFFSLRILETDDVPVKTGSTVQPGLGASLELGLRYAVSDTFSIRITAHGLWPDLADFAYAETQGDARRSEADYDPRPVLGLALGAGFSSLPFIGGP